MAGRKLENSAYGLTTDNKDEVETKAIMKKGWYNISLSGTPSVLADSAIDINGVLYIFDSEESITGSPLDGEVYLKITVSAGEATASWTNDALPAYDPEAKGFYPSANERIIARYTLASSVWTFENFVDYEVEQSIAEFEDFETRNSDYFVLT